MAPFKFMIFDLSSTYAALRVPFKPPSKPAIKQRPRAKQVSTKHAWCGGSSRTRKTGDSAVMTNEAARKQIYPVKQSHQEQLPSPSPHATPHSKRAPLPNTPAAKVQQPCVPTSDIPTPTTPAVRPPLSQSQQIPLPHCSPQAKLHPPARLPPLPLPPLLRPRVAGRTPGHRPAAAVPEASIGRGGICC